jgi:uncharacterized small protein (DUF1192 family)
MLAALDRVVMEAVNFFAGVDESLADGHQTARQVLSHLVFWHREYVRVITALAECRQPALKSGTFAELNAGADREFQTYSMPELAQRLASLQEELVRLLQQLTHWRMDFPVKQGGHFWSVEDRIPSIEAHIRNHVVRLKRAARKAHAEAEYRQAS